MNLTIITKKHAADPEIGFLEKGVYFYALSAVY